MSKKVNPFDGILVTSERRSGNTTRAVDNAIQILFRGDVCDMAGTGIKNQECKLFAEKVHRRLANEHDKGCIWDAKSMTISMDNESRYFE